MFKKTGCHNCQHWNKEKAIAYETGNISACYLLSGKHLPGSRNTLLYSTHYRGSNGPSQNIVTREDFYCNQHKP